MRFDDTARSAAVFGFGLGGLVDGIVLHQILQWHHLVSARTTATTLDGLEHNTTADGIFHAAVLAVLVVGVVLLVRALASRGDRAGRRAVAGSLVGFGVFHLVDAVAFHTLLELHHIRMVDDYLVYDVAFAGLGIAAVAAGAAVLRRSPPLPADGSRPAAS